MIQSLKIQFLFVILLILISSYNFYGLELENDISIKFEFVIRGNVKHGDGLELALYIPSREMDNRIIITIKNGKFELRGKTSSLDLSKMYFEEDIMNMSRGRWMTPVFLEAKLF